MEPAQNLTNASVAGARMITIDQVSKWYGSAQVLKRCTTGVAKGEVVVVCGPSGSGKSTLIKCVNGLEPFQEGAITVDGIAVGDRKTNLSKLRARIGMVFQHFELFPHLTVMRNLELAQIKVLGRSAGESAERACACSIASACASTRRNIPGSSPAASSNGSRSRARWRWTRSPCCSTSRPPRSIPR